MQISLFFRPLNRIIIFCIFMISIFANAQVKKSFTPRYNESIKGDVTIIANNMISRTATTNYTGTAGNHDFNNNVYVDIDNDNSTFNSSSANFTNPNPNLQCLALNRVLLYWAAADKEQDSINNNEIDNQPNWNYNDIKLMLPDEVNYTTITADEVIYRGRDFHESNDPYVCFKDITTSVLSLADFYGTYQVANVEAKIGGLIGHEGGNIGTSGGWQIVFVYESPELPSKNISLFDGYAHVTKVINDFDINFSGFQTIPTGNVNANVVIGSLEGDRDLVGDKLQILNTASNFVDISTVQRNSNNFFNSRITIGDNEFINRNPASTNTLGFDAAVFALDNPNNSIITNNQTSTTIRLTSNQETYGLFLIGFAVDVWEPNLSPMSLSLLSGSSPANAGDILVYDLEILNSGNDDAINLVLSATIPPQISFKSVNNLPIGITYTYDTLTKKLVFYVDDTLVNVGDASLDLEFEIEINDECYFLEDICDLTFSIQFLATYNGVQNPNNQITQSSTNYDLCFPNSLDVDIIQPIVSWATPQGALDNTIECDDIIALNAAQNLEPEPDKCQFTLIKTLGPFIQDASCPSSGTYINSWTFIDACGVTIEAYVQTINIVDTTVPTASNPNTITIQCRSDIPIPDITVVTDEADNCSVPIVVFVEDKSDNLTCPETITRTFSVTDSCGNSINVIQNIIINDTIPPTASPISTINLQCDEVVPEPDISVVNDASDNCSMPIVAFVSESSDNQTCSNTITRTYSVTDECGNIIYVTQKIIIADTVAPTLVGSPNNEITLMCERFPDVDTVEFTDECSAEVTVVFDEQIIDLDSENYDIIRTWTALDDCDNESSFTQTIHMQSMSETITNELIFCINDNPTDLLELIEGDDSGTWESNSLHLLEGNTFSPSEVLIGIYDFTYTTTQNSCLKINKITIHVNGDCEGSPSPCIKSKSDVNISKLVTPNGDMKNETFKVGYKLSPVEKARGDCDITTTVKMFSRWGNKVFESNEYYNDWQGASPSNAFGNADKLPAGTYYYVINLINSGLKPIQGYIYLGTEQ